MFNVLSEETGRTPAESRRRILLADDQKMVAEAVARLLERSGEYETKVVGTFGEALDEIMNDGRYDLLMLDVRMPGMTGLNSIERLMTKVGDIKVVLFSGEVDRRFVLGALELGVRGLIPKTMPLRALPSSLELVLTGQVFLPADLKPVAIDDVALSERELAILRMASDGKTNKEIALQTNSTEVSVKMHMRVLCKKLDARNRTHAAMIARDLSLL